MRAIGETIDDTIEEMKLRIIADQHQTGPRVKNKIEDTESVIFWLCVGAILLSIHTALPISRSITGPLQEIANEIGASTGQVVSTTDGLAETSQSLAGGAVEQAAALAEMSASLEEISAMAKRSAENAVGGKTLGKEARKSAASGLTQIEELTLTLNSIKTAVGEMHAAVAETQSSSQEIGKIIKTIDEIAFQTNLLALNAAVEAARAGEAGMGFAVVADEVRSLAQRSGQAAKDTAEKIEIAIKRSELGGTASEKLVRSLSEVEATANRIGEAFTGIAAHIKSLDELISGTASASQEQSLGITQVNLALTQLDQVTQENASVAEKHANASEEMNEQAVSMDGLVHELQGLITGHTEAPKPAQRRSKASERPKALTSGDRGGRKTAKFKSARAREKAQRLSDSSSRGDFSDF